MSEKMTYNSFIALGNMKKEFRLPSISVPDVIVLEEPSAIDNRIFRTEFTEQDVGFFLDFLRANPPMQRKKTLETLLTRLLGDWQRNSHLKQCPYEPFLWALKSTGGYLGTEVNKDMPDYELLKAVGNALLSVWSDTIPSYQEVLRNVILRWSWNQPVHIMIYLYKRLNQINSDEIDECLRSKWLYNALFSTNTFYCLCSKKQSEQNVKALMRFVSLEEQRSTSVATIKITNRIRNRLRVYLKNAPAEVYELAKAYYHNELSNCSRNARHFFDTVFGEVETENNVAEFIDRWWHTDSPELKASLREELRLQFEQADFSKRLIQEAANTGTPELRLEIIGLVLEKIDELSAQYHLQYMVESAGICTEYESFITGNYEKIGGMLNNEKSFLFACAYCHMGHPEILGRLFAAIYLNGICNEKADLFLRLQKKYPDEFSAELERIAGVCKKNNDTSLVLLRNCAKIYRQAIAHLFPVTFDSICQQMIAEVENHGERSVHYADALMSLYERIVNTSNRDKYHDSLMKVYYGTGTTILQNAHERAAIRIREIYG